MRKSWKKPRLIFIGDRATPLLTCQLLRFAGSEDCLFLNVHAPAIKNSSALPVMVFFYGGGFSEGSSYEMGLYDGQHLSSRHLVLLSLAW